MANKRKISNPLALAVLALLRERPMHPYDMALTMRQRRQEDSIKLRYGSLYTVIELLQREGYIAPQKTTREGNRPERTVYMLTEAGRVEMHYWLSELLSTPTQEFLHFKAALSLVFYLAPDEVMTLLRERVGFLDAEIQNLKAEIAGQMAVGVQQIFTVKTEYQLVLLEAERKWVSELVPRVGAWSEVLGWKQRHEADRATLKDETEIGGNQNE